MVGFIHYREPFMFSALDVRLNCLSIEAQKRRYRSAAQ
jgi:hypothetical protein